MKRASIAKEGPEFFGETTERKLEAMSEDFKSVLRVVLIVSILLLIVGGAYNAFASTISRIAVR